MNINLLENFINYEPVFTEDPKYLVEDIKNAASNYMSSEELEKIDYAYEFAKYAHRYKSVNGQNGQYRHSGEPYIVHVVRATQFLMKIKPGIDTIQTCLLHDVIEDTYYEYEDIKRFFGNEIADLCDGLVKVSSVRYKGEERNLETLKKTFLAMGKDLRVIFVKLADRIHNIQTLHYHPKEEKRIRIAEETLKVYSSIAQRLGLSVFQNYLENGAFYNLNQKEFNRILKYLKKYYGGEEGYVAEGIKKLSKDLDKSSMNYIFINGRLKSPYRIYAKLKKYNTNDISNIMDILAFRVITEDVPTCYSILGIINNIYTPLIKKIKDYIAIPKPNGYKSLHTTIIGMFKFPIEIQIRTKEMDDFAEYGVAAHFVYKEYGSNSKISSSQLRWIQKLHEIVKNFQIPTQRDAFKDALNIEVLEKSIFVYTPAGDIVEMPNGSTVLDFAFRIHTEVGLKFKAAFVNNKVVPKDYKLKTGDIVEIKKFRNKYTASNSWYKYLHTPSSKNKLIRFLKWEQSDYNKQKGREILNTALLNYGLSKVGTKNDRISKKYKGEDLDYLLMKVYNKQLSPTRLIKDIYSDYNFGNKQTSTYSTQYSTAKQRTSDTKSSVQTSVIFDEDKELDFMVCPECKPNAGDKIIGKNSRNGLKVHKLSCKALNHSSYDKLLEAHWKGEDVNIYRFRICLSLPDKPGILLQILSIFSEFNINISNISTENLSDEYCLNYIDVQFSNPSKMHFIIKELKKRDKLVLIKNISII